MDWRQKEHEAQKIIDMHLADGATRVLQQGAKADAVSILRMALDEALIACTGLGIDTYYFDKALLKLGIMPR